MSEIVLVMDEQERRIREAERWESGLAARPVDGSMGVALVLTDEGGDRLAACMSPEQAIEQARYIFQVACRMLLFTEPAKARQAAKDLMADAMKIIVEKADRDARASR